MSWMTFHDALLTPLWLGVNALLIWFVVNWSLTITPRADLANHITFGVVTGTCFILIAAVFLSLIRCLNGTTLLLAVAIACCGGIHRLRSIPRVDRRVGNSSTDVPTPDQSTARRSFFRWLWCGLFSF